MNDDIGKRVYVAAKFQEYESARRLMDAFTAGGYTITHDWTRTQEFDESGHPIAADPNDMPPEIIKMHAENDVRGVRNADFLVVLGDADLCGALIEVGIALALRIPIYVIKPKRWTIFYGMDEFVLVDHEDDVRFLFGLEVLNPENVREFVTNGGA